MSAPPPQLPSPDFSSKACQEAEGKVGGFPAIMLHAGAFQQVWLWPSKLIGEVIIEVSAITLNSCLKHYIMGVFSTLITVLQCISVKNPSIP